MTAFTPAVFPRGRILVMLLRSSPKMFECSGVLLWVWIVVLVASCPFPMLLLWKPFKPLGPGENARNASCARARTHTRRPLPLPVSPPHTTTCLSPPFSSLSLRAHPAHRKRETHCDPICCSPFVCGRLYSTLTLSLALCPIILTSTHRLQAKRARTTSYKYENPAEGRLGHSADEPMSEEEHKGWVLGVFSFFFLRGACVQHCCPLHDAV